MLIVCFLRFSSCCWLTRDYEAIPQRFFLTTESEIFPLLSIHDSISFIFLRIFVGLGR